MRFSHAVMQTLPPRETKGSSVKILMVEDSDGDVELLRTMLEDCMPPGALDLTAVPRLLDAFHCIEHNKYDLILLDLNLPDMNGISCVAAMHAELPDTPIIVYSGMDDPKLRNASLSCGASHYLVKGMESAYSMKFMIERTLAH